MRAVKKSLFINLGILLLACLSGALTARRPVAAQLPLPANGYALPFVGHWNVGETKDGFTPAAQMELIEAGEPLLLSLLMPNEFAHPEDPHWLAYYEPAIKRAAALKLPLALVGTQWEIYFSTDPKYLALPAATNPNVVTSTGQVRPEASPFGGVAAWREVGARWAETRWLRRLQTLYPDPPYVMFVSNNEHPKLDWMRATEDKRFGETYGQQPRSDDFKRDVVGNGWIERYRALQAGLREGLAAESWRTRARFVAYNAFGPSHFARWNGWLEHSLYRNGRIDPWAQAWEGASAPYYVFNWSAITDYTVHSPQIEAMNWVFMQAEARRANPDFWFELSLWDGRTDEPQNDKLETYRKLGQTYSPARYNGMTQFGMWLLRPQLVREFRAYRESYASFQPYLIEVIAAVKKVHTNKTLRDFWQKGQLVANRSAEHPYQSFVPAEYQQNERWFLLTTSLDPRRPWGLATPLLVYALALVQGHAPQRQWLVYAHAPLGDQNEVVVTIPNYRPVKINVAVGGSFYLVDEKWQRVTPVR